MKTTYFPSHSQNRMKNEGNAVTAREYFLKGESCSLSAGITKLEWIVSGSK